MSAARGFAAMDARSLRSAVWALRSLNRSRRQLRTGGVAAVDLTSPASVRALDRRVLLAVLRVHRASCLERSVVLQRFDSSAGRRRVLIVAVTKPGADFRAHAWLEGERQLDPALREIARFAAPVLTTVDPGR